MIDIGCDKTMYLYEDAKSNKPKETINLSQAKISYDQNGNFTIKIPTKIGFKKYTFRVPEKFSLEKSTVHQWQKIINETSKENKFKKSAENKNLNRSCSMFSISTETQERKLLEERRRGTMSEDVSRKITPPVRKAPKPPKNVSKRSSNLSPQVPHIRRTEFQHSKSEVQSLGGKLKPPEFLPPRPTSPKPAYCLTPKLGRKSEMFTFSKSAIDLRTFQDSNPVKALQDLQ